jgi:RNA polymerase sigma-54 factor
MTPSHDLHLTQGLKQELGLRLTPEMMLRIDVLQATHMELGEILNNEMSENPLIEDIVTPDEGVKMESEEPREKDETEDIKLDKDEAHLDSMDEEAYENVFERDRSDHERQYEREYNPEIGKINDKNYNDISVEDLKLQSYLIKQLNEHKLDDENYAPLYALITNIDDDGLLTEQLENISTQTGLQVKDLERALVILQNYGFEPLGVGARNPRESLLIQLRQKNLKDTLAYQVVDREFDTLSRQNYKKIAAVFKVKEDDVRSAEEEIKKLSPFPGRNFGGDQEVLNRLGGGTAENSTYITPDIMVDQDDETGKFKVSVAGEFPEIKKIKPEILEEYNRRKETKDFIKAYDNRLRTLTIALQDRNRTIKAVVEKIIGVQEEFLKNEEAGLKPLTLKEIAEAVKVHESTVSRIVSRKYIQMPYGVLPLKSFFASKLETTGGSVSSSAIKDKIRAIIEKEDKTNPLTDTDIAKMLNSQGVTISRRTITKYREAMDILPVNVRKK